MAKPKSPPLETAATDPGALSGLLDRLAGRRVLVVGDAMLDRTVMGAVDRVSPEAPIPVLRVDGEEAVPGGAANVARNLAGLGAQALLVAITGDDPAGSELQSLIGGIAGIEPWLAVEPGRITTQKTRFRAQGQQLLRADRETVAPLSELAEARILGAIEQALPGCEAVVLSDYAKGVLTPAVIAKAIALAGKRPVMVDPKGRDYTRYRGAAMITPNRGELGLAAGAACDSLEGAVDAARGIVRRCGVGAVLATLSQDGMVLVDAKRALHLPARAREVFDV
ncbi:MAG: bifunctional heptose 7-phosphate kinase/heptose 1-phosphate adenyltransferase, partial [Alphaproteobacteria bacterium]|nr:bifunctional heptose 7-phosphate kinase/heptose 1-phosphate adenyltransferase [Alphaproteobacteria bacterium]